MNALMDKFKLIILCENYINLSLYENNIIDMFKLTVFRSLKPMLRLLSLDQIPTEAQYWAVWALANLTRVNGMLFFCL